MSNYLKYRGKCKELAEKLASKNGYKLVRGFYYDPIWNKKEQHWWCVDNNGNIHDPTALQFPSNGMGEYEEFNGIIECANCGRPIKEEEAIIYNGYPFCGDKCMLDFVGLL